MFVVRLVIEGEVSDTKAFAEEKDARAYFLAGWHQIEACDGASVRLYRVPNPASASDAVSAVRNGRPGVMLLQSRLTRRNICRMPKGPKGEKRPADVIGAAVMVGKIATGEVAETTEKPSAAAELGRKGGKARAEAISAKRRAEIAKQAAKTRWRRSD